MRVLPRNFRPMHEILNNFEDQLTEGSMFFKLWYRNVKTVKDWH